MNSNQKPETTGATEVVKTSQVKASVTSIGHRIALARLVPSVTIKKIAHLSVLLAEVACMQAMLDYLIGCGSRQTWPDWSSNSSAAIGPHVPAA